MAEYECWCKTITTEEAKECLQKLGEEIDKNKSGAPTSNILSSIFVEDKELNKKLIKKET